MSDAGLKAVALPTAPSALGRAARRFASARCMAALAFAVLGGSVLAGCGGPHRLRPDVILWEATDPTGDVRIDHPPTQHLDNRNFDITHVSIGTSGKYLIVTVTFATEVRKLRNQRPTEYVPEDIWPQTVDVYLDTIEGVGRVDSLPDRGFYVPASEAWNVVLLMSSITNLRDPNVVRPIHLMGRGRRFIGVFRRGDIPGTLRGALVAVLATAPLGDGRVRLAHPSLGDCDTWDPYFRCTLRGEGPPVLDVVGELEPGRPVSLTYFDGMRPRPERVPVVFARKDLISAAPVRPELVEEGMLATLWTAEDLPIGTAIVISVVGDTASLKVLDGAVSGVESAVALSFHTSEVDVPPEPAP